MNVQTQISEVNARHASASVVVNDGKNTREYQMFVSRSYATIATGNAIRLRTSGKTFHQIKDIGTHYKRDGSALLQVAVELNNMIHGAAC